MRPIALYCVAVCVFGSAAVCRAQWPDAAPPVIDLSSIERLPAIDLPPAEDLIRPVQHPQPPLPDSVPDVELPVPGAEPEAVETPIEEIVEQAVPGPWSGSFELGLSGSDGNSEIFNFRFGLDLERKSDWTKFTLDLDYKNDSTDNLQTANRLFLDARQEWSRKKGPWSVYVHGTTEYDEFKDFNSRIAGDAGLTYNFIKSDVGRFAGRIGLGTSHEIGSANDEWVPEGTLGLDLERKISKMQKFVMSVDYFPDLSDFADSRIDSKFNYEIIIDAEMNLSLKLTARDRYDSTPGDAVHNDLDYSAVLLWSF